MHSLRVLALLFLAAHLCCASGFDVEETVSRLQQYNGPTRKLRQSRKARTVLQDPSVNEDETSGACQWDNADSECRVSYGAAADLFRQYDNGYAHFIAQFAECEALKDDYTCEAAERCVWDKEYCRCGFAQLDLGHERSPCIVNAPATFSAFISDRICLALDDEDSCNANHNCAWEYYDNLCDLDDYYPLFGFTEGQLSEVSDQRTREYVELFAEEFHSTDPSFDWDVVLDWSPQLSDCSESPNSVCEYVDTRLGHMMPILLYCQSKYSQVFQYPSCNEDPLCQFDDNSSSCWFYSELSEEAESRAFQAASPSIEVETDRAILDATIDCFFIDSRNECTGPRCAWFSGEDEEFCDVSIRWELQTVTAPGEGTQDPVCTYLNTLGESECAYANDLDACAANANCTIQSWEVCVPNIDYLITDVTEREQAIGRAYSQLEAQCSGHHNRQSCNSA